MTIAALIFAALLQSSPVTTQTSPATTLFSKHISDPAHLPNPQKVSVTNTGTLLVRIPSHAHKDWVLETNVTTVTAAVGGNVTLSPVTTTTVRAFEMDAKWDVLTYPSVGVTGNQITVNGVGDRTLAVYIEAPAGTAFTVVGSTDDDVLYQGCVSAGLLVSQGQKMIVKAGPMANDGLTTWIIFPHEQRIQMLQAPPPWLR